MWGEVIGKPMSAQYKECSVMKNTALCCTEPASLAKMCRDDF